MGKEGEERKREQKKETMKGAAMQKRSVWMVEEKTLEMRT